MRKKKYRSSRGFAVGEVIIAMAVVGVISLATVSLFESSINATQRAIYKAEANNLLESVVECYRVSESEEELDSALSFLLKDYAQYIENGDLTVTKNIVGSEITVSVTLGGQNIVSTYDKGRAPQ